MDQFTPGRGSPAGADARSTGRRLVGDTAITHG